MLLLLAFLSVVGSNTNDKTKKENSTGNKKASKKAEQQRQCRFFARCPLPGVTEYIVASLPPSLSLCLCQSLQIAVASDC